MSKDKKNQSVGKKLAAAKAELAEGTKNPLPVAENTPEQAAAKEQVAELVKKTRKRQLVEDEESKALREKIAAMKKELEEKQKSLKTKAQQEAEAAKAEHDKLVKQHEEADAAVTKAKDDLQKTEEWKALEAATVAKAALPPLTKAKKARDPNAPRKTRGNATGGPTVRQQLFEFLDKRAATGAEVRDHLGLTTVPMILKDEGVCDEPRIERFVQEGSRGVLYSLTAKGKQDLADGKVDENAAPGSSGKAWPE